MFTLLALSSALPLLAGAQSAASTAYTPAYGACPNEFTLVRQTGQPGNQTLSPQESAYVSTRKSTVLPGAWKTYLANVQGTNVTLPSYVSSILGGNSSSADTPTLGIACSGGGWRAAMFGAGVLNVLDGRNSTSATTGTGGLLQAATYLSGLSGGANLVGSFAQADFPLFEELTLGPATVSNSTTTSTNTWGGWLAQITQQAPTGNATEDAAYIQTLVEEVKGKYDAGFAVSYNDIAARDNGRHFVNGTTASNFFDTSLLHGAGYTFSSIASLSGLASYSQPFPILIATLVSPNGNMSTLVPGGTFIVPQSNPIMELNVYEMGSYDPTLAAFTPMQYLGTTNDTTCVTNYDQTGLIIGASGDWNTVYNTSEQAIMNSSIGPIITALNDSLPQTGIVLDTAVFTNSFYGATNGTFIDSGEKLIGMSDGASNGEAVPIQPHLVKARGVDTIFAIDSNQDWSNEYWSAGGSLINTQNRTNTLFPTAYSFPPVPTNTSEFIAQNLSTRPTFFGCDSSTEAPFIIYLANGGPPRNGETPVTNVQPGAVTPEQLQAFLDQTTAIALQGLPATTNVTTDPEWPACLACAVVDRARNRTGTERSGVCTTCFERYCWNGSTVGLEATTSGTSGLRVSGQALGLTSVLLVTMAVIGYF